VVPADIRNPPDLAELARHCGASGMARQKIPERLVLVEDFPRTPSGKIRNDVLRRGLRDS
jgi:non-ribosomal peptide synthetase component E (peptide arylation enzyme)